MIVVERVEHELAPGDGRIHCQVAMAGVEALSSPRRAMSGSVSAVPQLSDAQRDRRRTAVYFAHGV